MEAPPGALQRAVLVAVPLALVALIVVTPAFTGRKPPQPTEIPLFRMQFVERSWNDSVNETAIVYVQSALGGWRLYDFIEIGVRGVGREANATMVANGTFVPSLALKLPAVAGESSNLSAVAGRAGVLFRYNATVEFAWGDPRWSLLVTPDGATSSRNSGAEFSVGMRREAP